MEHNEHIQHWTHHRFLSEPDEHFMSEPSQVRHRWVCAVFFRYGPRALVVLNSNLQFSKPDHELHYTPVTLVVVGCISLYLQQFKSRNIYQWNEFAQNKVSLFYRTVPQLGMHSQGYHLLLPLFPSLTPTGQPFDVPRTSFSVSFLSSQFL